MGTLSSIRGGICSELNNEFDKMLGTLLGSKSTLSPVLNKYRNLLINNSSWSNPVDLSNGLNQVSALSSEVPVWDEGDFKAVKNMVESCSFLQHHPFLNNPLGILKKLEDAIKDKLRFDIGKIADALGIPEINFAKYADELSNIYKKFNFGTLIPSKSMVIDCITSLCDTDIREKLTRFNMLEKLLNIASDGSLDFEQIYSSANLTEYAKGNMRQSMGTLGGLMTQVENSISRGTSIVKDHGRGLDWM